MLRVGPFFCGSPPTPEVRSLSSGSSTDGGLQCLPRLDMHVQKIGYVI